MRSCIFSIITSVFRVTWSFRNHNNMLICCSIKKNHIFVEYIPDEYKKRLENPQSELSIDENVLTALRYGISNQQDLIVGSITYHDVIKPERSGCSSNHGHRVLKLHRLLCELLFFSMQSNSCAWASQLEDSSSLDSQTQRVSAGLAAHRLDRSISNFPSSTHTHTHSCSGEQGVHEGKDRPLASYTRSLLLIWSETCLVKTIKLKYHNNLNNCFLFDCFRYSKTRCCYNRITVVYLNDYKYIRTEWLTHLCYGVQLLVRNELRNELVHSFNLHVCLNVFLRSEVSVVAFNMPIMITQNNIQSHIRHV